MISELSLAQTIALEVFVSSVWNSNKLFLWGIGIPDMLI